MNYKLKDDGVVRLDDDAHIPNAPGNRDWREYQEWLAEGNAPLPADPPPPPAPDTTTELDTALTASFGKIEASTTLAGMKAGLADLEVVLLGTSGRRGRIAARPV